MLIWMRSQFLRRYGVKPVFILDRTWFDLDTTITQAIALGKHGWFRPVHDEIDSIHTSVAYNNLVWGMTTPGFRDARTVAGCGTDCREVTRRNGGSLTNALDKAVKNHTALMLLEGWTDMAESAGFYRSDHWSYPSQYINIVRQYADPEPETLRFEAEGADAFFDKTPANLGGAYADRALDVEAFADNSGWYVSHTEDTEWFEYQNVTLGCGRYRFTARIATKNTGKRLRLDLGNLPAVDLPNTNGLDQFEPVHLGQLKLKGGNYNLRLVIESTGGLNIDWFFVKRSADCYCEIDDVAALI